MNERTYRRGFVKGDKRIKVVATREGLTNKNIRLHYHLALEMPDRMSSRQVREEIRFCWDKANKLRESADDIKWYAKKNGMSIDEVTKKGILRNNKIEVTKIEWE